MIVSTIVQAAHATSACVVEDKQCRWIEPLIDPERAVPSIGCGYRAYGILIQRAAVSFGAAEARCRNRCWVLGFFLRAEQTSLAHRARITMYTRLARFTTLLGPLLLSPSPKQQEHTCKNQRQGPNTTYNSSDDGSGI